MLHLQVEGNNYTELKQKALIALGMVPEKQMTLPLSDMPVGEVEVYGTTDAIQTIQEVAAKRTRKTKTSPVVETTETVKSVTAAVETATRDSIRTLGRELCAKKSVDALMAVLNQFGVKKAQDIPEDRLQAYADAITEALAVA